MLTEEEAAKEVASEVVRVRVRSGKDRHSKVMTSKGIRDRRIRMSAETAVKFFEIQDRLGFDQPSKTLQWLILQSRAAIEKLAKLSPLNMSETILSPYLSETCESSTLMDNSQNNTRNACDFGCGSFSGNPTVQEKSFFPSSKYGWEDDFVEEWMDVLGEKPISEQ